MVDLAQQQDKALLTTGNVAGTLVKLTMPMVWGLVAVISQPLVDSYFVGQLGTHELAAMSYVFPVVLIFSSVVVGLGIGISAVLARLIGAGEWQHVRQTSSHGILLTLLIITVMALLGLVSIGPSFRMMGAPPETMVFVHQYMVIWYASALLLAFPMASTACLRAKGLSGAASAIMIVIALVNIILDPLLIFGLFGAPELGFAGAAWATLIANLVGSLMAGYFMVVRARMMDFHWPDWAEMLGHWRVILHVGLPSALTNLATPVAMAVVILIVSGLGEGAVAGFGVAIRIEAFALIVPHALSVIIGPFVGQNYGAGQADRIHQAMRQALGFSMVYGLLVALLLGVFADWIGAQFQADPEVISATAIYLIIVPVTFCLFAIIRIVAGAYNALGQPWPNVIFFAVKLLAIYIPLSYLGARYMGYQGVAIASALSNIVAGGLAYYWYRRHLTGALQFARPEA